MTRFQLLVVDEDRPILTTEYVMPHETALEVRAQFDHWKSNGGLLVIANCLVLDKRAVTIDLDVTVNNAERRHERLIEAPFEVADDEVPDPHG